MVQSRLDRAQEASALWGNRAQHGNNDAKPSA